MQAMALTLADPAFLKTSVTRVVRGSPALAYYGSNINGSFNAGMVAGDTVSSHTNVGTVGGAANVVLGAAPKYGVDAGGRGYLRGIATGALRQNLASSLAITAPTKSVLVTRVNGESFGGGQTPFSLSLGGIAPGSMAFQFDQTNAAALHRYFVNAGGAGTPDGGSALGRCDLLITETTDDSVRTLYYSGTTVTSAPGAAQGSSPADVVVLLGGTGTLGERAYYDGDIYAALFYVGTYPTDAQIVADLTAMGFPVFPFV